MSFIIQEQASPVLFEIGKEEATGAGGTIDFYLNDQDFLYFEGNASANFAIDLAFDAATTLDDALSVDDLINITLSVKNGSTPYYLTNFQIDGGAGAVTLNWEGGNAPSVGTANGVDVYQFSILKTSGNQYTVFAKVETTSKFIVSPEKEKIVNAAASATNKIFLSTEDIVFFTQTATSQFIVDLTYATGVTLNSVMATGDVKTVSFKSLIGTGGDIQSFTIDGTSATESIYFQDPIASATPGFINDYTFQVVKTGDATFNVDVNKVNLNLPVGGFALAVNLVVVAGGGGGGYGTGSGGGGAGGMRESTGTTIYAGTTYTVQVGAGGLGSSTGRGGDGTSSFFGGLLTCVGGGGGSSSSENITGRSGGSGGGGTQDRGPGGAGTAGEGNNGGAGGDNNNPIKGGGGGGKSAVGVTSANSVLDPNGGAGGAGLASSITGASVTYAGGGGAGSINAGVALGGAGGGGAGGGGSASTTAVAGTANTGGGGGGAGCNFTIPSGPATAIGNGANGGKGIVIISAPRAAAATTGSPTVTTSGGRTIYQFLDSGTITF